MTPTDPLAIGDETQRVGMLEGSFGTLTIFGYDALDAWIAADQADLVEVRR